MEIHTETQNEQGAQWETLKKHLNGISSLTPPLET